MGAIMQMFYWDCPSAQGKKQAWRCRIENEADGLSQAGFTALWLPAACKAAKQADP